MGATPERVRGRGQWLERAGEQRAPAGTVAVDPGNAALARTLGLPRGSGAESGVEQAGLGPQGLGSQGAGPLQPSIASAIQGECGGGQPLSPGVRADMEAGFGVDLSTVRVHTGSRAAALNRSVQADAFTVGSEVFIGGGSFQPETPGDRRLLAHELAHVVQQAGGDAGEAGTVSHPADPAEVEAERVAAEVTAVPATTRAGQVLGAGLLPDAGNAAVTRLVSGL